MQYNNNNNNILYSFLPGDELWDLKLLQTVTTDTVSITKRELGIIFW